MKKLSKKQKVIIFIAIIMFIVIIGIIIGAKAINIVISNKKYNTANNNSSNGNLIPEYIKKGITLGGVTGTLVDLDTSDANATPEDIIWGETAYVKGEKITGTKVVTVAHGKASQKTFEENTTLIDDYGNRVKVPAGFKISQDSATSVTGGVVIEDVTAGDNNTKGSQFVWVPIGDVFTNSNGSKTTITLGRYAFDSNGNPSQYNGLYHEDTPQNHSSSYANAIAKDINDFIDKATTSGGYYIGRYEAGDAYATDSRRTSSSSDTNPLVCKKGVYPYTNITQRQAPALCQGMYNSSNFQTDLINSYSWDTAIIFIQEFSGDTDYSRQNSFSGGLAKCGETNFENTYDVRCNIYDMAGNTREWSTETSDNTSYPNVSRGDSYDFMFRYVSFRNNDWNDSYGSVSARPILYL